MVTVFTAPISRASGDRSSSNGSTASLQGKVTLTPAKPTASGSLQEVLEAAPGQPVDVHEMIVAADAGGRERVLVQRRRQRLLDVGADEPDQRPLRAHRAASISCCRPPPRKSWAMRGSARMLAAVSSMRVRPCSRTRP